MLPRSLFFFFLDIYQVSTLSDSFITVTVQWRDRKTHHMTQSKTVTLEPHDTFMAL